MRSAALLILLTLSSLVLAGSDASAAEAIAQRLGRGVNMLGYDPIWKDRAKARVKMEDFARIRAGGFQHVRINLHAFAHLRARNRLDPAWLATLDRVVKAATRAGLMVILDVHEYQPCGEAPDRCRPKLLAVWEQLAARYRDAPGSVLFEVLNEPSSKLTPELWNVLFADVLAVIRRTNPSRVVIVGPGEYNNFRHLDALALPEDDRNLIVTVHYYDPFPFTHQGADWTHPGRVNDVGIGWGSQAERDQLASDIARIAAWGRERGRPILLGEFGAFDKAELDARVAWTSAVARAAEAHGLAWTYWQFEGTFGAFDVKESAWVEPIHRALVPR